MYCTGIGIETGDMPQISVRGHLGCWSSWVISCGRVHRFLQGLACGLNGLCRILQWLRQRTSQRRFTKVVQRAFVESAPLIGLLLDSGGVCSVGQ